MRAAGEGRWEAAAALIPAYQEERFIREVAARALDRVGSVLVVDDGSSDRTGEEAEAGGAEVIRHPVNRGKGAALRTGLKQLMDRGIEYVVLLDGDGQHLPEEIDRFRASAEAGSLFLVGNRMGDVARMPLVRRVVNWLLSWIVSIICGQPVPDSQSGFRMVRRALIPELLGGPDRYDYETDMLFKAARRGVRIGSVPVSTVYGEETSKIRPMRDTMAFLVLVFKELGKGPVPRFGGGEGERLQPGVDRLGRGV